MSAHAIGSSFLPALSEASVRKPVKRIRRLSARRMVPRTSQQLLDLLEKNPKVQSFAVEKIIESLGATSLGSSLMFFAIPEVLPIPIPAISALVVLPTVVISGQMVAGQETIRLPQFMLRRKVPRKALAAAIHALLPVLERVEKLTKQRWTWATSPAARRALGAFIFILALAIAVPIPGFNMPQAIAIFLIGLGLVENDGALVVAGVATGLASLALLGGVLLGLASVFGL